mmetsp:Transcript_32844/g.49545  ORF Transcript_32844/g.49545 Transcript_32844/m.49545 type:complete len:267 (-) Transcript_32844:1399-2199(-)
MKGFLSFRFSLSPAYRHFSSISSGALDASLSARLRDLEDSFALAFQGWKDQCDLQEYKRVFEPRGSNPTYGELDRTFAAKLLCNANLGPDDVFVDVGSGLGKLSILAVALTNVGAAHGLELSTSRSRSAKEGADVLFKMGKLTSDERERLHYWQGDCSTAASLPDDVWQSATAVLITSKGIPAAQGFLQQLVSCARNNNENNQKVCTVWSVALALPQRAGLRLEHTLHVNGFVRGDSQNSKENWRTKDFKVYEYSLFSGTSPRTDS